MSGQLDPRATAELIARCKDGSKMDHILFLARNVSLPHPTSEVRSVIQIAAY